MKKKITNIFKCSWIFCPFICYMLPLSPTQLIWQLSCFEWNFIYVMKNKCVIMTDDIRIVLKCNNIKPQQKINQILCNNKCAVIFILKIIFIFNINVVYTFYLYSYTYINIISKNPEHVLHINIIYFVFICWMLVNVNEFKCVPLFWIIVTK